MTSLGSGPRLTDATNIDSEFAEIPVINLTTFIADLISSGAPIIKNGVIRTNDLASGNTFTVCAGTYRNEAVAIKYFNFKAPLGDSSIEIAGESLRENLENASHEIRIMANGILRRCPNIVGLRGVFFELDDPAWIRPALVVELADEQTPTLTECLKQPLSPLLKRSLITNLFDGLYALHSVKICHADIKPDNILIFRSSENPDIPYVAKVSDFGFAFVSGQKPRGSGTAGWAAPECFSQTNSEAVSRERAYGRDIFSAALVMQKIMATATPEQPDRLSITDTANDNVLRRIKLELEPLMLRLEPEKRPWMEDLRKDLKRICAEEDVEDLLWPWVARENSMTQIEIEPFGVSAQLKGMVSTWLIHRLEAQILPAPIQNALVREMNTRAEDPTDEDRADNIHALFLCHHAGILTSKDPQRAWTLMWESARAGSTHAQGEAMHYVVRSRDYQTSTASERRDWSLACLTHKHRFGWDLLSLVDATVCEKGLRAAVFAHHVAVQRRMLRKKSVRSVAQVLRDSLAPHQLTALSSTISLERVSSVIAEDGLDSLAKIIETNIEDAQLRALFLRSLLEYATEAERKQLIFMLLSRFRIDATATDPATGRSALSTSIFEDRNNAVIWMTDSGVDRKLFGSQHIFGRVVCNSTYTMINTYVQLCHTYYGDLITKKLLNDGAPNQDGSTLPPPIALAILSSNTSAFEVLLRYDVDIEQRYGAWAPLLLSVARGLPLFCAMLIEKGASLDSVTADDTAMTIVHVLASSEVFSITGEDDLLYKVFDRPRGQLFLSPVTPSQERRFADHLIFSILKQLDISFNQKDSLGKDPMHVAIESGNLWIAAFLENPNWMTEANELPKVAQLQDFQGRTLLFYAIEDDDFELAERLLQQSCQIEVSDHAGKTVLHEAAEQNNIVRLHFCISHDAPVAHLDFLGRTALTFAIAHGSISMCEKILANAGPTILLTRTAADDNFMHAALKSNEDTLVVFLVEYYIENQKTNDLPAISELMAQRDVLGRTPLHHACHPRKRIAADASTGSVFLKLISLSPDISPRDNVGDTPLHDAVETADRDPHVLSCAHALIQANADVDAQNVFGNTPLHYAYQRQQRKSVELLIANGADRTLKNKQGFAPEEWGNAIKHDPAVGTSADAATHDLIHERSRWVDVETAVTRVKEENERRSRKARLDFLEANGAWVG